MEKGGSEKTKIKKREKTIEITIEIKGKDDG